LTALRSLQKKKKKSCFVFQKNSHTALEQHDNRIFYFCVNYVFKVSLKHPSEFRNE